MGFGERVAEAVGRAGTPLVLGIDPRNDEVPPSIAGATCSRAEAADVFGRALVEIALDERVAAVKPQIAFYEALGCGGIGAFAGILRFAREHGVLVIADAKRGDIGSTAEAYAAAFFGPEAPFACDALTVSPYLGADSIEPILRAAQAASGGIFALVRTSNAGARDLQELGASDGRPLYEHVARLVARLAEPTVDRSGYGAVGAVVGATAPEAASRLRTILPHSIFLAPGLGAQGAKPAALRPFFDAGGGGALIPVSRAISGAWRAFPELPWQDACRAAIRRLKAELAAALSP